jgi:hypothetical protein
MLPAIRLHDQSPLDTSKIGNKTPNRMLPPELGAHMLPPAQQLPQNLLRFSSITSHPASPIHRARCHPHPSTVTRQAFPRPKAAAKS